MGPPKISPPPRSAQLRDRVAVEHTQHALDRAPRCIRGGTRECGLEERFDDGALSACHGLPPSVTTLSPAAATGELQQNADHAAIKRRRLSNIVPRA